MPANIAHMLIAHKALQKLKEKQVKEYTAFAELLGDDSSSTNYRAYVNLGSMGPDLYCYTSIVGSVKDMIEEGFVQATGVTPWSYHLHSCRPNEFPLRLVQIIFTDAVIQNGKLTLENDDIRKLAYVAGHLAHIAADQIIHPLVNRVAGPYYRSGDNRSKHRECEVFQDYFLYQEVYRLEEKSGADYDFFKQDFRGWADCVRGLTTRNTADWFRYFLQRGFAETYGMCPTEGDIENSVDNLLLTLRVCQTLGPYRKAEKEYKKDKQSSKMYREYIKDVDYLKYYRVAVELAVVYLIALYEVYFTLQKGRDFTSQHKDRFLRIVRDADLSCPLEQGILEKAQAELMKEKGVDAAVKRHILGRLNRLELVTRSQVFEATSDTEVVTA